MGQLLRYAITRIIELEQMLLPDVPETVWPEEVKMIFDQVEKGASLPVQHQRRLMYHINRMWLEKIPVPSIITAARSLVDGMEKRS